MHQMMIASHIILQGHRWEEDYAHCPNISIPPDTQQVMRKKAEKLINRLNENGRNGGGHWKCNDLESREMSY